MKNDRKQISKKLRFEVFKRDGFRCQYCGRSAPQVILHVDHIHPVAEGGTNDIMNLITSCADCNLGKGARRISDDAVLRKEKQQLDELNERREQLVMMMQWRTELADLNAKTLSYVESCFQEKTGYSLADTGKHKLQQCLNTFSLCEVIEAIEIGIKQYGKYDSSGQMKKENAEKVFQMIRPICKHRRDGDVETELGKDSIYYVAGIIHNRFGIPKKQFLPRLKRAKQIGIDGKELKEIALTAKNYQSWRIAMEKLLNEPIYGFFAKKNQ